MTTWVPGFLLVILFGLSMDYEVFLLSRIREAYDASGDNSAPVARGLSRTARVISAAAAIMIAVFLSIVIGPRVTTKQIGLGLAVAILIDATVVRLARTCPDGTARPGQLVAARLAGQRPAEDLPQPGGAPGRRAGRRVGGLASLALRRN